MLCKASKGKPRGAGNVCRKFPAYQAEDAARQIDTQLWCFCPKGNNEAFWVCHRLDWFSQQVSSPNYGSWCLRITRVKSWHFSASHGHIKFVLLIRIISAFPQSMPYIVEGISVCQAREYFSKQVLCKHYDDPFLILTKWFLCLNPNGSAIHGCHSMKLKEEPKET